MGGAITDPLTVTSTNPFGNLYTQVTEPSVAWNSAGDFYVLTLQTSGTADGALVLNEVNFSGSSPSGVVLPNNEIVYQWVTGSDAATTPALAVDSGTVPSSVSTPPAGIPTDPFANNVYIAWASIDTEPADGAAIYGTNYNANRTELVVGTPISNPTVGGESSLAFSGVNTVNVGANFGPQQDTHPTLVINPGNSANPGQITIAWEDAGSGKTLRTPITVLMSNLVLPGDSYGFADQNVPGPINPGISVTSSSTQGDWGSATIYNAGPNPTVAEDPTSPQIGDVNGDGKLDIVVADTASQSTNNSGLGVLINQGGGVFPAAGISAGTLYNAGPNPTSVALGDFVAGHTTSTILDAALSNNSSPAGSVSVLPNGTPPTDGMGVFGSPVTINTTPAQAGTSDVVSGYFDGSSTLSLIAVNSVSDTISVFPDASSANSRTFSTPPFSPIAIATANFAGAGTLPAVAVLYSNGTVQLWSTSSSGPGNITLTAGPTIGNNIVAIAAGPVLGACPNVVAATATGAVEAFANTSSGGNITFNPVPVAIGDITAGMPVALATGVLSTKGSYVGYQDVAVVYRAAANGPRRTRAWSPFSRTTTTDSSPRARFPGLGQTSTQAGPSRQASRSASSPAVRGKTSS